MGGCTGIQFFVFLVQTLVCSKWLLTGPSKKKKKKRKYKRGLEYFMQKTHSSQVLPAVKRIRELLIFYLE